jgi:hypothetical protein
VRPPRRTTERLHRRRPGPVHGRGRVLRRDGDAPGAAGKRGQERASPRGPGPGGAQGSRVGGGQRWFGYTRIHGNPDEPNHKKRHILREEIKPVEADAIRDAAVRVLEHGESMASIARDWTARGIRPVAAKQWWPTSIVGTLTSPGWPGCGSGRARSTRPRSGRRSERVRGAWQSWNADHRRSAIRAVLHRVIIKPLPPGANRNVAGNGKDKTLRREREMAILRQRVEFDWRI